VSDTFLGPVGGGEPELEIARDLTRRAVWALPAALAVSFLLWRVDGVLSSAFAIALVVANFLLAAYMNSRAARISPALLAGVAMFGFLFRLTIVFAGFWLTREAEWMNVVAFGLTVVVAHLGLLFWEMKYISASLAFPGLKPPAPRRSGGPAAIKES
jgi:CDP-diglyceride synthetase